jgi:hypothetical protein
MDPKKLAESAIDATIRGFDPEDRNSYEGWDRELKHAEDSLRSSASELDPLLLASVRAERIRIAFEVGRFGLVLEMTDEFLLIFPATFPSFSLVASLRTSALHATGAHEEEIREALQLARKPELRGSEYVHLLASLSKRHPGCLPIEEDLWRKLEQAIHDLRAQGYDMLPHPVNGPSQLEEMAGRVADELRRVNWERGESLLNG